jgi:hypothetical protein
MTTLATHIELNDSLASWLGVESVALVREDLLPDGGGKKRRALASFANNLNGTKHIHLLSYAGSHTAFTLSQLLPDVTIHLYGTNYGGGAYERTMVETLNKQQNIDQRVGSSLSMLWHFNRRKMSSDSSHHFMKIGGSRGSDPVTETAVGEVISEIGNDYQHIVAVASGDLLKSIRSQTKRVTGVLTQPLGIKLIKSLGLNRAYGFKKVSLGKRVRAVKEVRELTGNLWDPIFMGTVFNALKNQTDLPPKLCIWVTCPSGISWLKSKN